MDMNFNGILSDPHSRYTRPTGGSDFNQIGGVVVNSVLPCSPVCVTAVF